MRRASHEKYGSSTSARGRVIPNPENVGVYNTCRDRDLYADIPMDLKPPIRIVRRLTMRARPTMGFDPGLEVRHVGLTASAGMD
jgi:hypothetical protein